MTTIKSGNCRGRNGVHADFQKNSALVKTGNPRRCGFWLTVAREIDYSATLMYVLNFSARTHIHCGNYAAAAHVIRIVA